MRGRAWDFIPIEPVLHNFILMSEKNLENGKKSDIYEANFAGSWLLLLCLMPGEVRPHSDGANTSPDKPLHLSAVNEFLIKTKDATVFSVFCFLISDLITQETVAVKDNVGQSLAWHWDLRPWLTLTSHWEPLENSSQNKCPNQLKVFTKLWRTKNTFEGKCLVCYSSLQAM